MEGLRILSRTIPLEPLSAPLPDGDYALICFRGKWTKDDRFGMTIPNPFPWWVSVVRFSGGLCDDRHSGSNIPDILSRDGESIKEVLIIEMSTECRRQLDQILAEKNIELIDA